MFSGIKTLKKVSQKARSLVKKDRQSEEVERPGADSTGNMRRNEIVLLLSVIIIIIILGLYLNSTTNLQAPPMPPQPDPCGGACSTTISLVGDLSGDYGTSGGCDCFVVNSGSAFSSNSSANIYGNLTLNENSSFTVNGSLIVYGDITLLGTSNFVVNSQSLTVHGNLYLNDTSRFIVTCNGYMSVLQRIVFNDLSTAIVSGIIGKDCTGCTSNGVLNYKSITNKDKLNCCGVCKDAF